MKYKTTIVIWSEYDPADDPTDNMLSDLARDAEQGSAYCSQAVTKPVEDPASDPDWDRTEFFDTRAAEEDLCTCGKSLTEQDTAGGRCTGCLTMLCTVDRP